MRRSLWVLVLLPITIAIATLTVLAVHHWVGSESLWIVSGRPTDSAIIGQGDVDRCAEGSEWNVAVSRPPVYIIQVDGSQDQAERVRACLEPLAAWISLEANRVPQLTGGY